MDDGSAGGSRSGKEVDPKSHLHPAEAPADPELRTFLILRRFGSSGSGEAGTVTPHAMIARLGRLDRTGGSSSY